MEPATFSEEAWVCPRCGDEGFTNAFVFCVKCLDFPIHRYCLDVIPRTLDEPVIWVCEHCKPAVPNQVTLPKAKSSRSQKEEAASLRRLKATHLKKKRKEKDIASLIAGTEKVDCREKNAEPDSECIAHGFPKKERTKRKQNAACLGAKRKEHGIQSSLKTGTQRACTTMADSIQHSSSDSSPIEMNLKNKKGVINSLEEQIDDIQLSRPCCETEKLISDYSSMKKGSDKVTNDECQAEMDRMPTKQDISTSKPGTDVLQLAEFENNAQDNHYRYAEPVTDPVWRGSFDILDTDYDLLEGFVAHLSNKACDKAIKEANMFPSLLSVEMHPNTDLWPKSFQEHEPTDDQIALYFFPGDPINERAFDHLVTDMVDKGLAMRCTTTNAELLIFTSILLPRFFWRFQGKYYLWGVFKNKRNDSTVAENSNKYDLSNKVIGEKKILTRVKTLDVRSPQSPLSNNGENGVDMDRESGD